MCERAGEREAEGQGARGGARSGRDRIMYGVMSGGIMYCEWVKCGGRGVGRGRVR